MEFCVTCTSTFFFEPVHLVITLASIFASIGFLISFVHTKSTATPSQRLQLLYGHFFTLVFPLVFFLVFSGCQKFFSYCGHSDKVVYLLIGTALLSLGLAAICAPILYIRRWRKKELSSCPTQFAKVLSSITGHSAIQPIVHFIDSAKPIAFSTFYRTPRMYLSVGLLELLTPKEIEAVLLHEMFHLKNRSAPINHIVHLIQLISPIAHFTEMESVEEAEEILADSFAYQRQKTWRYVNTARKKIDAYYIYDGGNRV